MLDSFYESAKDMSADAFNDTLIFRTGDVQRCTGKAPITVRKYPLEWFTLPFSRDRRCTRASLRSFLQKTGHGDALGFLSKDFLQERERIMGIQNLSAERIAFLLQVAPSTVKRWARKDDGLSYGIGGKGRRDGDKVIHRDALHGFMQKHGLPLDLVTGYLHDDSSDMFLGRAEILQIFATHLCENSMERAQARLNMLLDTQEFARTQVKGNILQIPRRDIDNYLKKITRHSLSELQEH